MKKRILTIALVIALLATCFGGTLAYLTDTESQTNVFTTGNVYISLDEAVVEKDENGNLIAKGEERTNKEQTYHLYPAMTVTKDPTIYVDGSEPAWVAAIVTVTGDIHSLIGVEGYDNIDITQLASGGLMSDTATQTTGWNGLSMVYETAKCVIYQAPDKANDTWKLYIFMKEVQPVDAEITLFTTLTIPADWDNEEMDLIDNMKIVVDAYATQTNGFEDCFTAMTTAFDTAFPFAN